MYFPDLGKLTQIARGEHVRAIGWLAIAEPYSRGEVAAEVVARLAEYARVWSASTQALGWPAAGGPHTCEFCGAVRGSGNYGVPSGDLLYVCPEMVVHYVRDHAYLPPREFVDALLVAPVPGTPEYQAAVARFPQRRPPAPPAAT